MNPQLKNLKGRTVRLRQRMGMHIYVLPNLLTTMNMFFGFFAIIYAIRGEFLTAAYAIVGAAVFDLLDGRVARLTHSTSQFGAEYDSLCDLVSFGIAPGILLYLWALQPFGRLGWLASFVYVACVALRLARFNVQATTIEKSHFQGLPSPMGAGIVASSVLAFTDLGWEAHHSWTLLGMTVLLAFVMVSTFPYRSFKDFDLRRRLPFQYLVAGVVLVIVVASNPELNLFLLFLGYTIFGAFAGIFRSRKPQKIREKPIATIQEDDLHEVVYADDSDVEHEDDHSEDTQDIPEEYIFTEEKKPENKV